MGTGGWVGGWVIDVPCDCYTATVYSIYRLLQMPILLFAETFSCGLDVALRLFVVSKH